MGPVLLLNALAAGIGLGMAVQYLRSKRRLAQERESADLVSRRKKGEEQIALMGTLASGFAHELRNPLSTLRINLQLLHEEWQHAVTDREQRCSRKIEVLLRETDRLNQILDNFLRFAAGHELRKEPVQLNRIVEELCTFIAPQTERAGIQIQKRFDPALPDLHADPGLLRQAITNLILNAQQAMPEGGVLSLRTDTLPGRVRLHVQDSGTGIPAEIRHRVFDIYFSTKPSGTGLGLPITKKIVEEHGGTITIQSEPGRGTCVTLDFPHEHR